MTIDAATTQPVIGDLYHQLMRLLGCVNKPPFYGTPARTAARTTIPPLLGARFTHEIWEQEDEEAAQALLREWILCAESTGICVLQKFARTLRIHAFGILAWYDYPISTGPLGGSKLKVAGR